MLYYKKIDILLYDEIVNRSLNYVKEIPEIFYRQRPAASFYELNLINFLKQVPEINTSFKELGLTCIRAAVHVMYKAEHTVIHKDTLYPLARINIPLLNCNNTYTEFYKNVITIAWKNPDSGIISYPVYNDNDVCELADRVELTQATVLRVSEAHTVHIDGTVVPRIALTLGFYPNPIFLLNENDVT
jgi:hypothetical protein